MIGPVFAEKNDIREVNFYFPEEEKSQVQLSYLSPKTSLTQSPEYRKSLRRRKTAYRNRSFRSFLINSKSGSRENLDDVSVAKKSLEEKNDKVEVEEKEKEDSSSSVITKRSLAEDIDYVDEKSSYITQQQSYTVQISNSSSLDLDEINPHSLLQNSQEVEESSNLMVVMDKNDSRRKSISINGKEIPLNMDRKKSFASNFEGIFGNFLFFTLDESGQLKQSNSYVIGDSNSNDDQTEEYQPYTSYWMQCIQNCLDSVEYKEDSNILD